jgi:hypothetical protein
MTTKEHLTRDDREIAAHDKQIRVIRDLVKEGIRLVVTSRQDTRCEIRELTAAQKRKGCESQSLDRSEAAFGWQRAHRPFDSPMTNRRKH